MARHYPIGNEGATHWLRRRLPPPAATIIEPQRKRHEDLAFFLVSFASAFIILYGFVIS